MEYIYQAKWTMMMPTLTKLTREYGHQHKDLKTKQHTEFAMFEEGKHV